MTVFSTPGSADSSVSVKSRYGHFIGGEWVDPVKGAYFENISPVRARTALRLSHPKGNSLTAEMLTAIGRALGDVAENRELKLLTLEAAGPDFSFGASIPEHAPDRIGEVLPLMHRAVEALLAAPAPTAAVVRGRCLGGGFELALACDFVFAAETATFGLPEVDLGVFPQPPRCCCRGGSAARVPRAQS
jgi:enoyl-CoA hydratase/carnithine racemase